MWAFVKELGDKSAKLSGRREQSQLFTLLLGWNATKDEPKQSMFLSIEMRVGLASEYGIGSTVDSAKRQDTAEVDSPCWNDCICHV